MNIECLSIYSGLFEFLSIIFYTFQCIFYTSFVKCIPKYFILYDAIANKIVFLVSLSHCSLLVYRNIIVFLH